MIMTARLMDFLSILDLQIFVMIDYNLTRAN